MIHRHIPHRASGEIATDKRGITVGQWIRIHIRCYKVVYVDQSGSACKNNRYQKRLQSRARRYALLHGSEVFGFSFFVFPINGSGMNGGTFIGPVIEHAAGRRVLVLADCELYGGPGGVIPQNITVKVVAP